MEKVRLIIDYESEEPGGFESVHYEMNKTFEFAKLPPMMGCHIRLRNDAIPGFNFRDPVYDPKKDLYIIVNRYHEGVERYYHGDAKTIMAEVISRFKHNGWIVRKVKN